MRLRRSALSFLLLTGLSLGVLSPAQAAEDPEPAAPGATSAPIVDPDPDDLSVPATHEEAEQALDEVHDLFAPVSSTEARAMVASGESREATLALRDLYVRLNALTPAERVTAANEYGRPWAATQGMVDCESNICVHWFPTATDGHAATDSDYARFVLRTLADVSATYVGAGYRLPLKDGTYGGPNGETDIYLDDIGKGGKYGYCTVDVNSNGTVHFPPPPGRSDLPAFCVLDNDMAEFPGTAERNVQVTAAHEYFHAVQFAYDFLEDRWFMEATATWAEDQVYDGINDNVQYLRFSQLRHPGLSLDTYNGAGGGLHYGDWLFFEHLTERLPARQGPLVPVLVKRMWDYADSRGRDYYSIQAVAAALAEKHVDFRSAFGRYAAANRHPATAYEEGRANHYPTSRPRRTARLRPGHRSTSGSYKVNHLASATVRFVPKRLPRKRERLTLKVNMADRRTGSVAVALVYFKTGRVGTRMVRLGKGGNGRIRLPFSSRRVARVELVLANANHAYKQCSNNVSGYSCGGVSRRDHVTERFSAKAS